MRKNLVLLGLSLCIGGNLVAMEENDPLPPTPKEKISRFLVAKNQGRAAIRALATPRGDNSDKTLMRSDFKKIELEIYQKHVMSAVMKDDLDLKADQSLYIDEPFPTTMLFTGADGMRSGFLAKTLAKIVDGDLQEILDWRAKGVLDLIKGFAVTGDEKRDKVILIRDIALLGRDLQGLKEQSHMMLYDQLKNSIKALYQRKHQVNHRVYVVAATAYEESLPVDIKDLFKKTYPLMISDTETAGAIVQDFVKATNGGEVILEENFVQQLQGLSFDDLKDIATDAAKEAVKDKGERITSEHLMRVLATSKNAHEKMVIDHKTRLEKLKEPLSEKKEIENVYSSCVLDQVPMPLRRLYKHSAASSDCYTEAPVYLLCGERGLGKTMAAKALAERRNAEFIMMTTEDVLDAVVGKTQKNIERLFEELKQKEKEGKKSVVMLRGIERLVPANRFGDEEYELKSLRASLLACIKKLGEHTVLLLCADTQRDKIHQELIATMGSERCVQFSKPKDGALKAVLLKSMCDRLIKQKEVAVDFVALADKADAFTCADLENVVRSAGRKAIVDNAQAVTSEHFEQALGEVKKIVKAREENSSLSHCYI